MVLIEGRLQTRSWQGKDGQERRTTEIIAERVQFGPRSASSQPSQGYGGQAGQARPAAGKQGGGESQATKEEEVPTVNLDSEEVKPEDLPF